MVTIKQPTYNCENETINLKSNHIIINYQKIRELVKNKTIYIYIYIYIKIKKNKKKKKKKKKNNKKKKKKKKKKKRKKKKKIFHMKKKK